MSIKYNNKNISDVVIYQNNVRKNISSIVRNNVILWKREEEDIPGLCITALEDNCIVSLSNVDGRYEIYQGGEWHDYNIGEEITLDSTGNKVYFRAFDKNQTVCISDDLHFSFSKKVKASGNVNYLIDSTGEPETIPPYVFAGLFHNCATLITAPELPAIVLSDGCYESMFNECTLLTQAPKLPATTLSARCYSGMFYRCFSLTQAPELPATTLYDMCYKSMFTRCISLTQAPKLPATTLTTGCYSGMFGGCTLLAQAPELPATILPYACYQGMFSECTSLTQAPELPAAELTSVCYTDMFNGCININSVKTNQTSFDSCTRWLNNVSDNGTFICPSSLKNKLDNGEIERSVDTVPENWIVIASE